MGRTTPKPKNPRQNLREKGDRGLDGLSLKALCVVTSEVSKKSSVSNQDVRIHRNKQRNIKLRKLRLRH